MEHVILICLLLGHVAVACSSIVLEESDFSTTCRQIESQKKGRLFLFTMETLYHGCTLKCVFLESSSFNYREYFDKTVTHVHYFSNEEICNTANYSCSYGRCKEKVLGKESHSDPTFAPFGAIMVEVGKGFLKRDDGRSKADPYIRFKFNDKKFDTRVLKDTYNLRYNEEFVISNFSINDNITVTVYDRDKLKDDWVNSFQISPKQVLLSGQNGRFIEYPLGKDNDYIEIRLFWRDAQ